MKLKLYQIDAFANRPFEGNPAAVIPLKEWLSDESMQAIAEENHLSETAFFVPLKDGFHIRWFTPEKEVKLCGHATLACAYVIFNEMGFKSESILFDSLSGKLLVSRNGDLLTLDFPLQTPEPCPLPEALVEGLGKENYIEDCLYNEDYLVVVENEEVLAQIKPNLYYIEQLDLRGLIVTAPSSNYDFVARFFAPKYGIAEDPVTGSAFTQLAPYWSKRLEKNKLKAKQISSRSGEVLCELREDRVLISGKAVKYLEGIIQVDI